MVKKYAVYKSLAKELIMDNVLILDTETTGVSNDDEILELAVIDASGAVLYNSCFKPEKEIHWAAAKTNGFTYDVLKNMPYFKDEYEKIINILSGSKVAAFNEPFDERMFYQTAKRYNLDDSLLQPAFQDAYCVQRIYNHYLEYHKTKLEIACLNEGVTDRQEHRALDDCFLTLALLEKISDSNRMPDKHRYMELKHKFYSSSLHDSDQNESKIKPPGYLSMYEEGKSVEEMAEIRGCKTATVEEALIALFKNNEIDNIDFLIQEEYIEDILTIIQKPEWDKRLKSVKEQLPDSCTYNCIRSVIEKYNKGLY